MMKLTFDSVRCSVFVSVLLALVTLPASAAEFKDTYPKIGAIEIAGHSRMPDPAYRAALAKHDLVIIGLWRGWSDRDTATGNRMQIRDAVVDIKNRARAAGNPGILVGKYTIFNESETQSVGAKSDEYAKLSSERGPGGAARDWWARNSSGEHVSQWPGTWHTNLTRHVIRDSDGNTYPEWYAHRAHREIISKVPELDIWYFDNVQSRPRVTADWNGDGLNDDRNADWVRRDFRQGIMDAVRRAKQLAPDMIIMGNVDYHPFELGGYGALQEPEFKGQMIGLMEAGMGYPHSVESWNGDTGWYNTMKMYQMLVRNAQHNVAVFEAVGTRNDYKMMRYALTSALMDNGYFYYTDVSGSQHFKSAWWFDEYDVDLGRAVDSPRTEAWQNGVFMRRFEKGMALVNPKANGRQTVQIPAGYARFSGSQDPAINNGQPASQITLNERDGIILVKVGAEEETKPSPPVVSIQ